MRHSTLALFTALPFALSAQITITNSEMPHAGDELLRTRAVANPFLNYGNTGAGTTWNFANLVAQEQATKEYVSVGSTNFIYALYYADIFFNPNRANHATAGSDIPFYEQLPIEDPYTFFYRSSSVYKKVGYGASVAGIPLPISMEDQDVIYELPLDYGDASNDNSAYQIEVPSLAYYGYSQTRTNEVDGWGAITTPAGSFDVLRVKTTLAGRDSINLDSLGLGFAIDRPLVTEYKWLASGYRVPILQINTTEIFGLEIITEVWFYDEPRSVNVVEPFTLSLCPGSTVPVPYEATGAFNQGGFLVQANIFRAQLSDANGDFTNAVNIGSVTATTSGIINATIPANTPVGSGYRIRVVATNPAFVGEDNGEDITIGLPPIAMAAAFGTTTFCNGGDVLLQANAGSYTYQWQVDGNDIAGANGAEYTADATGSYTVIVSDACGTDVSDAIVVSVNETPAHTLMQDVFTACEGETITITAVDLSGQSDLGYQWFLDGAAIDGATLNTIAAEVNGSYMVQATNTLTGCSFTTDETVISFEPLPVASIAAASNTSFCAGGSVELTTDVITDATYQWTLDGAAIDGATTNTLLADASGTYAVSITSVAGCSADATNTIDVLVLDAPPAVAIDANTSTTFCAGGSVELVADEVADASYEWSLDGDVIPGAATNTLTANTSGNYTVMVTNLGGCSASATNTIDVLVLDAPPAIAITANASTTFCAGGSVELVADEIIDATYAWSLDNVVINGATTNTLAASASGNYTVIVTNLGGCSASATNTIDVLVLDAPPAISITANASTTFCAGGSVELVADEVADASYVWSLDNVVIDGATTNTLTANASGTYTVNVTNLSGCSAGATNSVDVTVLEAPAQPVITQESAVLTASGGGAFQWYLDGTPIDGATEATYTVLANGSYVVQITGDNGCTSTSDPYLFLTTSIRDRSAVGVSVYPNPAHDRVTLIGASSLGIIRLVDATGRVVLTERATALRQELALHDFAPGAYTLLTDLGAVRLVVE